VVHAWPRGEARPLDPVARAFTDPEGAVSFHLPVGRYALTATREGESRTVAVTVERAGRATVLLEEAPHTLLRTLRVEVVDVDGRPLPAEDVEAAPPDGSPAHRARTDGQGLAPLVLAPGLYDVRAAGRAVRVQVEHDARLRVVRAGSGPAPDEDEALLRAPVDATP
jgi:hypothetical protein